MSDDEIARTGSTDLHFLKSIFELQEKCHRLVELVSESQARIRGMEIILALFLGRILANRSGISIANDCLEELEKLRRPELDNQSPAFPDQKLLEEVIAILSEEKRRPWRPQVIEGGKPNSQYN